MALATLCITSPDQLHVTVLPTLTVSRLGEKLLSFTTLTSAIKEAGGSVGVGVGGTSVGVAVGGAGVTGVLETAVGVAVAGCSVGVSDGEAVAVDVGDGMDVATFLAAVVADAVGAVVGVELSACAPPPQATTTSAEVLRRARAKERMGRGYLCDMGLGQRVGPR
ncbi:MAG TPA: hypothetical protein VLA89_06385 [Gemmatimonadales bacterium]|nr:hypothetical protein [Gemmatimonadales bacterium]